MFIDKTWTTVENRNSTVFQQGLESFIERFKPHVDIKGQNRSPCTKCNVNKFILLSIMKVHILQHDFCPHYTIWKHHGENKIHPVVKDIPRSNEMVDVIVDDMGV